MHQGNPRTGRSRRGKCLLAAVAISLVAPAAMAQSAANGLDRHLVGKPAAGVGGGLLRTGGDPALAQEPDDPAGRPGQPSAVRRCGSSCRTSTGTQPLGDRRGACCPCRRRRGDPARLRPGADLRRRSWPRPRSGRRLDRAARTTKALSCGSHQKRRTDPCPLTTPAVRLDLAPSDTPAARGGVGRHAGQVELALPGERLDEALEDLESSGLAGRRIRGVATSVESATLATEGNSLIQPSEPPVRAGQPAGSCHAGVAEAVPVAVVAVVGAAGASAAYAMAGSGPRSGGNRRRPEHNDDQQSPQDPRATRLVFEPLSFDARHAGIPPLRRRHHRAPPPRVPANIS